MLAGEKVTGPERREEGASRERLWQSIAEDFGPAIERLARGYEADVDRQRDLAQEILFALWKALPYFEGRSSLRTWLYGVAHNVAVTHVMRGKRDELARCVPLDAMEDAIAVGDASTDVERRDEVQVLASLVRRLRPADRQLIMLYLEGLDNPEIAEVTGLSRENVATKVHRIKAVLTSSLKKRGGDHGTR
jgi:RNA polymerase sigma-70 factor, ECF subfamily